MPSATVTVRELKNKHTGIDITIPRFTQEKGLLQSTYEYQVVVVSNLPYFKSPKHKESDVVQFMVKKKFSDFEELWSKLFEKYHSLVLPPLPKKALLVNDKVATERRSGLEKFLSFLASSPKVCTSSLLLEFLGVNAIKAGKYTQEGLRREESNEDQGEENKEQESLTEGEGKSGLFEEEDEDTEDLFNEEQEEEEPVIETEMASTARHVTSSDTKLFEYPVLGGNIRDEDFFQEKEEPNGYPLSGASGQGEDNSDLLNVQDDLDELFLEQSKSKREDYNGSPKKPKPTLKPKPVKILSEVPVTRKPDLQPKPKGGTKPGLKPKPASKHSKAQDQAEAFSSAADLDTDDIMKYIQNAEEPEDDIDLFA